MESFVVVAPLKPNTQDQARDLIAQGPPMDLEASGLTRHSVYLSANEVIFLFEGPDAQRVVEGMVNDPVMSAQFSAWGPLLDGTPFTARRVFDWSA